LRKSTIRSRYTEGMNLHDSLIAIIRTAVPALVGTLFAWLLSKGIEFPDEIKGALTTFFVTLCITGYYAAVTWLERKVNPAFGWLLGIPKAPTYSVSDKDAA